MAKMADMAEQGKDCWLGCVQTMERLLKVPVNRQRQTVKSIDHHVKSSLDRFWLKQINRSKPGHDGQNHNKLRTYNKLNGFFEMEPHLIYVRNRNQRTDLTRLKSFCTLARGREAKVQQTSCASGQNSLSNLWAPSSMVANGSPSRGQIDDKLHAITDCQFMADYYDQLFR